MRVVNVLFDDRYGGMAGRVIQVACALRTQEDIEDFERLFAESSFRPFPVSASLGGSFDGSSCYQSISGGSRVFTVESDLT